MGQASVRLVLAAAGAAAALFLTWQAAETLLIIFAGILLGVLLDTLTRALEPIVPLGRGARLTIVCLLIFFAFLGIVAWSGYALAREWDQLAKILSEQLKALRYEIDNLLVMQGGTASAEKNDIQTLAQLLLPDPGRLFGGARSALSAALGVIGSGIVVILIGIFAAASPETYHYGILRIFPSHKRARVSLILDEIAQVLRWWLLGQLITMAIVGISTSIVLAALGVPGAMLLGIQAGLLNFIPYVGPFLSAVPILLAAASQGMSLLIWAGAIYLVIQTIESYVLSPLVQDRAIRIPPVLTLAALMVFGALFGAIGIAMATPIVAAVRVLVVRLYADDAAREQPRAA
jgi:predicted PurR-regulated permease PerM